MKRVLVVGGGAAGCMAAYNAAVHGGQVTVLEKMAAVGRKMLIAGKGRCNVTNDCDIATFIKNMPGNGQFLYSALHAFPATICGISWKNGAYPPKPSGAEGYFRSATRPATSSPRLKKPCGGPAWTSGPGKR